MKQILLLVFCLILGYSASCSLAPADSPQVVILTEDAGASPQTQDDEGGYPAAETSEDASGYPVPTIEGLSNVPPNPEVQLPATTGDLAVIGGVLVRELVDSDQTMYVPLSPSQLILAPVGSDSAGNPAFLEYDDNSLRAEVFDTGVFIFNNVSPGQYGIIVNIGITEFPVLSESSYRIITVNEGDVIDLGQVLVQFP